jgi:hypothetical protein
LELERFSYPYFSSALPPGYIGSDCSALDKVKPVALWSSVDFLTDTQCFSNCADPLSRGRPLTFAENALGVS